MPFRLESDTDLGPLLARLQVPNVDAAQARSLENQQMQAQLDRAPALKDLTVAEAKQRGLQNEQMQMDLDSQKKGVQALQQSNGDANQYLQLLRKSGAGPKFVAEQEMAIATARHAAATADQLARQNEIVRHDQMVGDLTSLEGMPEEQRAQGWTQFLDAARQRGHLTPEEYAAYQQHYPQYPGSDMVSKVLIPSLKLGSQINKDAEMAQQIASQKAAQAASEAQAKETQQKTIKEKLTMAAQTAPDNQAEWSTWYDNLDPALKVYVPAMFSPAALDRVKKLGLSPAEVETARHNLETEKIQRTNAENNVSESELAKIATDPTKTPEQRAAANAALRRLDQSKLASRPIIAYPGVPTAATGDAANLHGEDYLKTLPAAFAARVRKIYTGDEAAPTGRAAMAGPGLQLMNAVYQAYPDFTTLTSQNRKKTLDEFTSTQTSRAGGQLLALNTLIHHADLYLEVADALKNGSWRPGNALYNKVAQAFGSTPPIEANLVARFLAGETGKVATGGVPAEGEVNGILANLNSDNSPDQLQKAGQRILQIAAGRMVPLKERRDQANLQQFVTILGPDARDILQKRGYDPETMKPAAAAGGALPQPTSRGQAADANTIAAYLRANGNDKDKTRKALTDAGWTIPAR